MKLPVKSKQDSDAEYYITATKEGLVISCRFEGIFKDDEMVGGRVVAPRTVKWENILELFLDVVRN